MNTWMLLAGIVPVFVFVIVDSFSGLKTALVTAIIFAVLEAGLSIYVTGELDSVTLFSVLAVLGMGLISYKTQSGIWFKMQPVVLSGLFFLILVGSYLVGKPLIPTFMLKYKSLFPESYLPLFENEVFINYLSIGTLYVGIASLLHALVTAYAALKLSNWWWLVARVAGFYLFIFVAVFLASQSVDFSSIQSLILEAVYQ